MVIVYQPKPNAVPRIYIGRIVHSRSLSHLEILPNAALGVRQDGTIAFLHHDADIVENDLGEYTTNDFSMANTIYLKPSQFLFPGFIDTHLHAPQWPNLALGMEGDLREWVEHWTDPMEASYSDTEKARLVYADVVNTTLGLGSTTVAYNTTIHEEATNILAELALKAGQRAIVGKMCITLGATHGNFEMSEKGSIASSERSIKKIQAMDIERRYLQPCVQPRGGPFCPPDLMLGLGRQVQQYDAYVQGHMCETHSDIDRTLKLHQAFDCYSDMYKHYGLLTRRSIMAHCIHMQPKDFENMRVCQAGVAHNPNSNTCLRDGECRVRDLLDYGIKVGLGTDCSAGYMPSIHDAMRSASNVSRHLALKANNQRYILGFSEIVYLATMGGAEVVDMADRIGNFQAGKQFDALLVDVKNVISVSSDLYKHGSGQDEALVKKWVFLGDNRSIKEVYVAGKLVAGYDLEVKLK